nr:hypothetical protein BaRGS_022251 [Batillaria attramentaria]
MSEMADDPVTNSTAPQLKALEWEEPYIYRNFIFSSISLVVNFVTMVVLCRTRLLGPRVRVILVSMTANDVIFSVICGTLTSIPLELVAITPLCYLLVYATIFTFFNSCFSITLITIDRMLALYCPLLYRQHATMTKTVIGVLITWLAAFLFTTLAYFSNSTHLSTAFVPCVSFSGGPSYGMLSISVISLICVVAVTVMHILIFLKIRQRQRLVAPLVRKHRLKSQIRKAAPASDDAQGENRDVTKVKKRQLRKTAAKYTIREDVLYHDGILVAKRNQVPEILQEFHDNYVSGGHLGMNKTYKKVLERYFWHGMKQEVEDYCRSCCVCQNMNACRKKPAAPLHPIPVPKKKWSLVGMDIIGPLQVTDRGNQYIVALTDHFTKFPVAKAIPCKSSEEVARFMYETICIFGAFDSLITDQGREFINFALDILTDRFNINHRISSAYHPETNGQRERDNRTLKDTLVKITDNDDWDELLPAALFAYRTSVHKSTQFSPFLALYGEQAKLPFDVTGDANEQDLNEEIMDTMKGIHEEVKNKIGENISRAQKKQKEYYDSRRAYDHGFRIGDKVLIINAARVHRMGGKMAPRFVGPYEVSGQAKTLSVLEETKKKLSIYTITDARNTISIGASVNAKYSIACANAVAVGSVWSSASETISALSSTTICSVHLPDLARLENPRTSSDKFCCGLAPRLRSLKRLRFFSCTSVVGRAGALTIALTSTFIVAYVPIASYMVWASSKSVFMYFPSSSSVVYYMVMVNFIEGIIRPIIYIWRVVGFRMWCMAVEAA